MPLPRPVALLLLVAILCLVPLSLAAQSTPPDKSGDARELAGLWEAKLRWGPDTRGSLLIYKEGETFHAQIAGRSADCELSADTLRFELPENLGKFRGRFLAKHQSIFGHWNHASPVTLTRVGKSDVWRGLVNLPNREFTWYLKVEPRADGTMRAFLKNPDRNQGYFMNVASLERDGNKVRLMGPARGGKPAEERAVGVLDEEGTLSMALRGGTYDFQRVADGAASDFYPRLHPGGGASYHYQEPPQLDDGWPVATPEEAGLSRDALEQFVRWIIDTSIDSVSVLDTHAVLIARHGKLVLEEYFHGENRDKPHDSRSASKSLVSVLYGAAIQSGMKEPGGAPLSAQSRVYQVINGGKSPEGLDARKQKLNVAHLLTMSSGLDADDSKDDSPGAEDRIQEGDDPNWWRITLNLNMVREPGEKAIYASMQPNLIGAVLRAAAQRSTVDLYHDLVFEPMQIQQYWLATMANGESYNGGGTRLLPRDFAKFPQLFLNGGTWNGKRVVSADWVKQSIAPQTKIGIRVISSYGYLWWLIDYPYQGKTITAFYAAGNGGQIIMGIPALDLVFAHFGGNYQDNVMFQVQRKMIPDWVLPAVVSQK